MAVEIPSGKGRVRLSVDLGTGLKKVYQLSLLVEEKVIVIYVQIFHVALLFSPELKNGC
jgi:hypothetical protein